uniref:Homoserine O-acetyltransferase n=1 Tax=Odontella aurita TaxID=265563 RepID=A0A7S4JK42_9STRA|mmetsp:Transcript_47783/g.144509  ORF Transcript_47783/g.144509 Transcript_47783/m.144509 type:complete len:327 (+) Transcript_47783:219-1199(+)
MPIKLPRNLPAFDALRREGVMLLSENQAVHQDIRPLKIGLLNLMPKKITTETQFARLIGATPLQIELSLLRMGRHKSKNTSESHLKEFYRTFCQVRDAGEKFDGLIITGAPIETLPFESVGYWDELTELFDWTQTHVHRTLGVCWGGMAMIHHFHGIPKHLLEEKVFGCYQHKNLDPTSPYLRGFSDACHIPVSRWTEMRQADIDAAEGSGLRTLITCDDAGPALIEDPKHRALYFFNHFEYDTDTLKDEYDRDIANATPIKVPVNYFKNDDPSLKPVNKWRGHGHLFYGSWINTIYQTSPFNIEEIGQRENRTEERRTMGSAWMT